MTSPSESTSSNGKEKSLPFAVTIVVSVVTAFVCAELLGFPWWARLLAVVVVTVIMEAVNQAVGRARALKQTL
ncbi:hypothetical protein [Streptomyces sp. NPDC002533]